MPGGLIVGPRSTFVLGVIGRTQPGVCDAVADSRGHGMAGQLQMRHVSRVVMAILADLQFQ